MVRAAEIDMSKWAGWVEGSRTWRVTGLDTCMRTVVRHALFADVEVQAVDRVTFHAWDGLVESSLIAHRMGQLPIMGLTPLTFELKFKAPDNAPLTWVTADHITNDGGRVVRGGSDGPFLLVPLLAGQRVHVTCTTSLGSGRRKATWNSVFPVVKVEDEERDNTNEKDALDAKSSTTTLAFTVTVETTGACTPGEAMQRALTAALHTFTHIASPK